MGNDSTVMLRPIADVAGRELLWAQPSALKRDYELRTDDEVVATLRFERGTLARADAHGGPWAFRREGFWHPQVTIRAEGSETNLATFRPRVAGGGELDSADGNVFQLGSADFWHSEWQWRQRDQVLVRFKRRSGLLKTDAVVEIAPDGGRLPELPLLVVLGWYLILLYARDTAVQAATVASRTVVVR